VITFVVIATKRYTRYAHNLIRSLEASMQEASEVILLTDDIAMFLKLERSLKTITLRSVAIESLGWPRATLLRYELISKHLEPSNGDVVCYLDADTLMVRSTSSNDFKKHLSVESPIALVQHPGYFRRNAVHRTLTKSTLGPWETRSFSSAYVPFSMRSSYVCGGVIFGQKSAFIDMCHQLKSAIDRDAIKGIVAKHNDESYLNRWAMKRSVVRLSPEWAFSEGYRNLRGIIPRIQVIHKPSTWVREG